MYKLYFHGGSENHGCEAIVRSTRKILNRSLELYSTNPGTDHKYDIDKVVTVKDDSPINLSEHVIKKLFAAVYHKFTKTDYMYSVYRHLKFLSNIKKGDVCFSIGGDNYCYAGTDILADINLSLHRKGAKTILWGCSLDSDVLKNDFIIEDMKRYDLITVRESLSQRALADAGIIDNVYLFSDPAFQLEQVNLPLPANFIEYNTVAINVSPLIIGKEISKGIVKRNYINLMEYILQNTNMNILLLPHVVLDSSDDRKPLMELYELYKTSERVVLLDDFNCMELKGYISRCRLLVAARTHAAIAAYSTCVPTLVMGYSVKAKGIATDIFGTHENYVIPVQDLKNSDDLTNGFRWLMSNEFEIKQHLQKIMPAYCENALKAGEFIRGMFND